jgi:hypothetical protein
MVKLCASCGAASSRSFKVAAHERGLPRSEQIENVEEMSRNTIWRMPKVQQMRPKSEVFARIYLGVQYARHTSGQAKILTLSTERNLQQCFFFLFTGGKCCNNRIFAEKWKNYFVAAFSVVWKITRPVRTLLVINSFDAKAEADDFKGRLRERCSGLTLLLR